MRRSEQARLWTSWALRDARKRWVQLLSIGLLLALGVGMYSAMSSMSSWRTASADASFAELRMHDLRVSLAAGSYVPRGTLNRALRRMPDRSHVAAAEERLVAPLQVEASRGKRRMIVPGRIVGAPLNATVDRLATTHGRVLRAPDEGQPVVELERNFAKHYDLPASGSLRLTGNSRVLYAGQVLAPEYFIVTAPGADFGAEANFAVLFSSLRTAQLLTGRPGSVNELVLRLRRGEDFTTIRSELERSLQRVLPGIGYALTAGSQEPARRLLYKDAEGDQQMMDIFAFLLLGAAALAVFNLVSRTVEAQRREIGIGMALGVPPRMLALRPLMLGGQVALLGVVLGIPVGLAANAWLRSVMESFFPLPVVKTPLHVGVFARATGLGVAISLLATVIPLRRALSVSPVEAIRVGARAAKSSGLAWITRGLRLPGGCLSNMPLRNVLRAPQRTVMTVLGIAAVVAITLALAGMIDSFNSTLDASRAEALAGAKQRLTVDLAAPQTQTGAAVRAVSGSPFIAGRQTALRLPGTLATSRGRLDAFVEVSPSGPLWHPTLLEGTLPAREPGLLIAKRAAQDLHVRIGSLLAVSYPVRGGPSSYMLNTVRLPVTGINASPLRFVAYVNESAGQAMGVEGLTNRISVVPAAGRSGADVKRALLALPSITAVQGASATTDAVSDTMAQFTDVLTITVAIAVIMSFLIAYNSATINAEERTREHATLFAYGVRTARVLRGNAVEALLTGLLATVIGVGAGYAILRLMIDVSMRNTMPDLGTIISISAVTYALAALAGVVSVTLAPLLTLRRLRHTDIPSALRVVE